MTDKTIPAGNDHKRRHNDDDDDLAHKHTSRKPGSTAQPCPRSGHMVSRGNASNHEVMKSVEKNRYTIEEELKLIVGVERCRKGQISWEDIKEKYFKDSNRTPDNLKQKWKDFKMNAEKRRDKDDDHKELYMMVLIVQFDVEKRNKSHKKGKKCTDSFEERFGKLGEQDREIKDRVEHCLEKVKKMTLEEQVWEIKNWVKAAK